MQAFFRAPLLLAATLAALMSGCGGSSSQDAPPPPPPPAVGDLKRVSGAAELEASIKASFTIMSTPAELALAPPAPASADFTGTYTQEVNVDEFDTARYDGTRLYVAPRRYLSCCFITPGAPADATTVMGPASVSSIRILSTNPEDATATLAGSIPLEDGLSVQGMYLEGERLFALTASQIYGSYGDFWNSLSIWAPERLGYRVYDVSDPAGPVQTVDVSVDGVLVDSRRVGNIVYIVSRFSPTVEGLIYSPSSTAEQAQNEQLLATVDLDALLPQITVNGQSRTLVDPNACYIGTDDNVGYPVITSVTAVPIDNPAAVMTTCYDERTDGIYVTQDSVYFTQGNYDSASGQATTRIHKFALAGMTLGYRGSADVVGNVWRGGQADFRMSEHNGDLRIVASVYGQDSDDFVDHRLYVLRESATLPELDLLAELPNAERPEEIGKPNEALYGVRFLGDRAYAVTFEQIDPLYVIDLSNPADPQVAGELTVTGFSDFLHPVSDELLLGLGTAAGGGVKLELFDVSVITQPLSRGSTVLGGSGTRSEAAYDRHAFTYLANVDGVDRVAIPATVSSQGSEFGVFETSLHLFEIRDKTMANLATLQPVGEVAPPSTGEYGWVDRNRAYLNGDAVYYVRGEEVWGAMWTSPETVNGPF